jgi:hypothetical protein
VIQIPTQAVAGVFDAEPVPEGSHDEFSVDAPPSGAASEERKKCPMCGELIAAKAIKCRFCGEVLDASMRGMIASAGDTSDPRWRRVRSGLATLYYSIATIVIAAILMGIGAAIGAAIAGPGGNDVPAVTIIIFIVCGLIIFGAAIGALVGQVMCVNVPEASGAKGFIIGAIICMAANLLFSFVGALFPPLSALGSLASLVGYVLFILFIRQSAAYLGDQPLASSAIRFLIFGVVFIFGLIALGVIAGVGGEEVLLAVLGLSAIVGGIVALVWYLRLIRSLMATIDRRTGVR